MDSGGNCLLKRHISSLRAEDHAFFKAKTPACLDSFFTDQSFVRPPVCDAFASPRQQTVPNVRLEHTFIFAMSVFSQ